MLKLVWVACLRFVTPSTFKLLHLCEHLAIEVEAVLLVVTPSGENLTRSVVSDTSQ